MREIKVIVKREFNWHTGGEGILLFFPETKVNRGRIECWDGGHNEADMVYYWGLDNPLPGMAYMVEEVLQDYERLYQHVEPFTLKRVMRDSHKMRKERWKR